MYMICSITSSLTDLVIYCNQCFSLSQACSGMDKMRESGMLFVETVTKMLQRLLEYRHIIQDEIKDHRMSCIVNLLVRTGV